MDSAWSDTIVIIQRQRKTINIYKVASYGMAPRHLDGPQRGDLYISFSPWRDLNSTLTATYLGLLHLHGMSPTATSDGRP